MLGHQESSANEEKKLSISVPAFTTSCFAKQNFLNLKGWMKYTMGILVQFVGIQRSTLFILAQNSLKICISESMAFEDYLYPYVKLQLKLMNLKTSKSQESDDLRTSFGKTCI